MDFRKEDRTWMLAQMLNKDQGNVLKDAKALEALGLIELESVKEGNREKSRPKALYDKIVFEFEPKKAAASG